MMDIDSAGRNLTSPDADTGNFTTVVLPGLVGLGTAFLVSLVGDFVFGIVGAVIALFLLHMEGGVGFLVGLVLVPVVIVIGSLVAHAIFFMFVRPRFQAGSLLRSKPFLVGYGIYVLFSVGRAIYFGIQAYL